MKMTIKFKGLRVDGKGWVYSTSIDFTSTGAVYLASHDEDGRFRWHEVKPETVCQFTGLVDFNGVDVYEGDLMGKFLVVWHKESASFQKKYLMPNGGYIDLNEASMGYSYVTSNIHETPAP
jgi:hypothetical protein